MPPIEQAKRTFGPRVVPGGNDLTARIELDYRESLFRREYRHPVLISTVVAASREDLRRWGQAGAERLLGYDLAARALNRLAAEAAEPLYMQAVIRGAEDSQASRLRDGIADACVESHTTFADGSAGCRECEAALAITATGVIERERLLGRSAARDGDILLAVGSDRLWADTLPAAADSLARADQQAELPRLKYLPSQALLRPAPLVVMAVHRVLSYYRVKRVIRGMMPVEDDGLPAALERLLTPSWQVRRGKARSFGRLAAYLDGQGWTPGDEADEGHRRGIGFLILVAENFADAVARRMRGQQLPAYRYGRISRLPARQG
jgi:phosphoribosylformylglycinamidine cyclo-ligase